MTTLKQMVKNAVNEKLSMETRYNNATWLYRTDYNMARNSIMKAIDDMLEAYLIDCDDYHYACNLVDELAEDWLKKNNAFLVDDDNENEIDIMYDIDKAAFDVNQVINKAKTGDDFKAAREAVSVISGFLSYVDLPEQWRSPIKRLVKKKIGDIELEENFARL